MEQWPRRKKGRRGLPAARLLRWSGRGCRGGLDGHTVVRIVSSDGRSRSVHVRRRVSSSVVRNSACSRRDSPIKWARELHWMLGNTWVRGIGKWLTGWLGSRAVAGDRSPVRAILLLRWGNASAQTWGSFKGSWGSYPRAWWRLKVSRNG
jgi:hypothetical protein